jgi:hypothetical protein
VVLPGFAGRPADGEEAWPLGWYWLVRLLGRLSFEIDHPVFAVILPVKARACRTLLTNMTFVSIRIILGA